MAKEAVAWSEACKGRPGSRNPEQWQMEERSQTMRKSFQFVFKMHDVVFSVATILPSQLILA